MGRKPCADECDCLPVEPGFYWATHRKYGWRTIVEYGPNGNKHLRVFTPRQSSSFGVEEFKDWSGPITEKGR